MLDPDALARRLKGARELAGMKQRQLAEKTHRDGLGIEDVGRMERPTDKKKPPPELTLKHVRSFARHLQVPEAWFTEPDLHRVFTGADVAGDLREQLAAQGAALQRLADMTLDEAERDDFRQRFPSDQSSEEEGIGGSSD